MKSILIISILMLVSLLSSAQSIFDINMTDVNTDQSVTLKEYQNSKAMVVVFISTKCPYAKYYETRLSSMEKQYKNQDVTFLMVNPNSTESMGSMKSQALKMNTTYLRDEAKELTSFLGAKKSPEVFLLNSQGKAYYSGAIDDNPQVANDVRASYLKEAIDGLLSGKSIVVKNNRPVGCTIK